MILLPDATQMKKKNLVDPTANSVIAGSSDLLAGFQTEGNNFRQFQKRQSIDALVHLGCGRPNLDHIAEYLTFLLCPQ